MTVVYTNALKDTRMTSVLTAIDANGTGSMEIGTTAMAIVLVIIPLTHPSFSEASQTLTLLGVPLSANAIAGGVAAAARIKDGVGNIIISGLTVGTSGTDIVLSATSVNSGQSVQITSGSIIHG